MIKEGNVQEKLGEINFNVKTTACEFTIDTGSAQSLLNNQEIEWGQTPKVVSLAGVVDQITL